MNQDKIDIIVAQKNLTDLNVALNIALSTEASRNEVNQILAQISDQLNVIREARAKLPE